MYPGDAGDMTVAHGARAQEAGAGSTPDAVTIKPYIRIVSESRSCKVRKKSHAALI